MTYDASLLSYFLHAGLVVKVVMLLLICASILSWTYILQRGFFFKDINESTSHFETAFWSGEDLSRLYSDEIARKQGLNGLDAIFHAGFKEFLRFRKETGASINAVIENTARAMNVAQMREQGKLEKHLSFLAIIGSTSPYVGLFGTVWGIMTAFRALANVQQATIAMVAPGIAEALIATALGLFAAIPAVIAYNRFVNDIGKLMTRYDAFKEEFTNILIRQMHQGSSTRSNEAG